MVGFVFGVYFFSMWFVIFSVFSENGWEVGSVSSLDFYFEKKLIIEFPF